MKTWSRRRFLRSATGTAAAVTMLPDILPSRLFGAAAPGKKIQIAQIGCGRMGRADLTNILGEPLARVVAVCDVDSHRLSEGKQLVEEYYQNAGEANPVVKTYHDCREVLTAPDIDAVIITVPDHSHAWIATLAALAGKHSYVQKPVTYSIAEAICLRRAVEAKKIILQTGSQQRSERPWRSFRAASEAVRNGRIGQLHTIRIGIGLDHPAGKKPVAMPVPENLDFERWLGPAPEQAYMEGRVHPQDNLSGRPGWMTTEDFGLGMITNWGAHHLDIAQWAMGQELGGPLRVEARAHFTPNDLCTVHNRYHVEMEYPKNVKVILDDTFDNGIHFAGDEGWVFCARTEEAASAASTGSPADRKRRKPLRASDANILSPLGPSAIRWAPSKSHYGNWLESIVANTQPIAPIQQSARSLAACATAWISMKLGRAVNWDATLERFVNDDDANRLRARTPRKAEYDCEAALKNAGLGHS